jgi:hypothetical protein
VDIKKNRPFTICGYTKRVRWTNQD